jgi:hypothetical protein
MNEMELTLDNNKENKLLVNNDKENEKLGLEKTTSNRYNLRPNRELSYNHKYSFLSVHASIHKWGEKAKEAVREELRMFKREGVFEKVEIPTEQQKKKALMIHCFVIEKRDGRIKARAVANGRSQQRYSEEETYSPTVKLESIMLNAFIDAYEGRHVATVDIKGAFLKAKSQNTWI